ncbi:unnamed protein product [Mycena citricolor]|uniref:Uncharacterized protein n=1 Tax=Mycena citricolor TaxID=2018698 RepID=A0AAD2GWQ1_9AGAR|nr:unnamed protein product [Mycena citricolor]
MLHADVLLPTERSRLVRSARKLQALLGVTPEVITAAMSENNSTQHHLSPTSSEAGSSSPRAPIVSPDTLSSTSSSSSKRLNATAGRPRLYLHLDAAPASSTTHLSAPSPPLTPVSPTLTITLNILSPAPPATPGNAAAMARRRHAQKLARTLGENVAPALASGPELDATPSLRRSRSALLKHNAGWGRPRSRAEDSEKSLPKLARSRSFVGRVMVPLSPMHDLPIRAVDLLARGDAQRLHCALQTGRRRKEREWSGEWNTEMRTVAQQLRTLKFEM